MKTLKNNPTNSTSLKASAFRSGENTRPKIGDDDGITDSAMNFIILLFMLLTVGVTVFTANATPTDDVKYRILLRQAMLDIDRMQYDQAITKLLEVRANTTSNANVDHLLGKCYLYGEVSSEKAVFYLNRAADNTTTDYESWDLDETEAPVETLYLLAKAYEKTEHFDMAADYYTQFIETVESGVVHTSSRTYALLSQNVERCRIAADEQGNGSLEENVVLRD